MRSSVEALVAPAREIAWRLHEQFADGSADVYTFNCLC